MSRYFLLFVWVLGLLVACRGDKKNSPPAEGASAEEEQAGADHTSPRDEGPAEKRGLRKKSIDPGTAAVLGLVLPQRMTPAKSAPDVYRFTGNYPVSHLVGFFREQLTRSELTREGEGYLIRFGKVRRPVGRSSGEELLAIRIGRGMKGAIADIWQEKDYKKALPESYRRSVSRRALVKSRKSVKMTRGAAATRKREKEDTLRVMNKIAAGQKLDAKDYESPFFD